MTVFLVVHRICRQEMSSASALSEITVFVDFWRFRCWKYVEEAARYQLQLQFQLWCRKFHFCNDVPRG